MTNVLTLPYRGSNIKIDPLGNLTIFGWQASGSSPIVRAPQQPDGSEWANEHDGWTPLIGEYAETALKLLEANRMGRPQGNRGTYRLEVNPAIVVHWMVGQIFGLVALMQHKEGYTGDNVYVDIPLNAKGGTAKESIWHNAHGVVKIRVTPAREGLKLINLASPQA